ncbi:MAG TPA: cation diffusion facilitator family transporter [Rickettsiales bacterium]|nr:cation diffusion facilitator family transporter [Rickettsiales bacterium]
MAHAHSHDHHHSHDGHASDRYGRRFIIAAVANLAFIIAELIYGWKANSLSLIADAGHNFGDVVGLLLAGGAWWLSRRAPTDRYTYGFGSSSIMASLVNAILLLVAIGGVMWEAAGRLHEQAAVSGGIVMGVAALGIVVNGATAWLFHSGHRDLNVKAAFLHLAGDAAIAAGVVIAGFIIMRTGWVWLDPLTSIIICVLIIWSTWQLLRSSVNLALHAAPDDVDTQKVREALAVLPGVSEVHDLHVWGMSTTESALSTHLLMPAGHPGDEFLENISVMLKEKFGIGHATIQIELGDGHHPCAVGSDCSAPEEKI